MLTSKFKIIFFQKRRGIDISGYTDSILVTVKIWKEHRKHDVYVENG